MERHRLTLRLDPEYVEWLDLLCKYESLMISDVMERNIKVSKNAVLESLIKSKYQDVFEKEGEK